MHARVVYILGVGKGVLFREVSSVQWSGIEGFHFSSMYIYTVPFSFAETYLN